MNGFFINIFRCRIKSWVISKDKPGNINSILNIFNRLSKYTTTAKSSSSITPVGNSLDSESVGLCNQVFDIISHSKNWDKNPSLLKLVPSITPLHVCNVLNNLNLDARTALGFFNWIESKKHRYKHDVKSYSCLLVLLIRAGLFSDAKSVRDLMIKSCGSAEEMLFVSDEVRRMKKYSEKKRFTLSLRCYNHLLMGLAKFNLIDEMEAVFIDMLIDKISPNNYTFNTMIKCVLQGRKGHGG